MMNIARISNVLDTIIRKKGIQSVSKTIIASICITMYAMAATHWALLVRTVLRVISLDSRDYWILDPGAGDGNHASCAPTALLIMNVSAPCDRT